MDFTGIKHRGAKDGVSGSCHQLDINASASFLVNCGLFQGDDVSIPSGKGGSRQPIDFLLDAIKALVILPCSHRHIGTSAHWAHPLSARGRLRRADSLQRGFGKTPAHRWDFLVNEILVAGGAGFIDQQQFIHIVRNTTDLVINLDKLTYARSQMQQWARPR